jgi:hypothetical protein
MQAEEISPSERLEIISYKVITYMPVFVTFGVFGFLFTFYSYVSATIFEFYIYKVFLIPNDQRGFLWNPRVIRHVGDK